MSVLAAWLLAVSALQTPPSGAPSATPPAAVTPAAESALEPYDGSLAEGLGEVHALSSAGHFEEALVLCARLLAPTRFDAWRERQLSDSGVMKRVVEAAAPGFDLLGLSAISPQERAAVRYAEGIVASAAGDRARAESAFQAARSLAGPGELRLASIYNLGVGALLEGEESRAKIPEIQGGGAAPGAPAPPPTPAPAPPSATPGAAPEPDPLDLARAAYLRAKGHLVERVRAQWDDADTRANLELVQRRLKELDEIQRKREEQKKEQEKKDQDQKQDQDDQKKDDQKKDGEQDPDKKPDDPKDKDPNEQNKPEDEKKEPPKEEPKPDDAQKPDDKKAQEPKEAPPPESLEKLLTKEEMMRLLDILKQHEDEGQKLQAQLRQSRRAKVRKDW